MTIKEVADLLFAARERIDFYWNFYVVVVIAVIGWIVSLKKTLAPLADEVLFGHLKAGGHVRVIVDKDEQGRDKLGFQFLDGPITPKPEKIPAARPKAKRRPPRAKPKRGSVPKVPLAKV